MIRLTIPSIEDDDIQAIIKTLKTGYLIQGSIVKEFEDKIASYLDVQYAVALSNCTAALHLSLLAIDLQPGDIVLVTAYSWIATANVIELCKGHPFFVDIKSNTFNINPEKLKEALEKLTNDKKIASRVKAIIPVHTFGNHADMEEILDLANKYNLKVIEDAACAFGSKYKNKYAGTWGDIGCLSFHPRKAITTGEGGMLVTNNIKIANTVRSLRNHGMDQEFPSKGFIMPGFNYRMTEFQASLGISQLNKMERIILKRRKLSQNYNELLRNSGIVSPFVSDYESMIYQSYVILLNREKASKRDNIIEMLKEKGIETTIGTIHMPLTHFYRTKYGFNVGDFPITDEVNSRSLTLPLYESLRYDQQVFITDNLLKIINDEI